MYFTLTNRNVDPETANQMGKLMPHLCMAYFHIACTASLRLCSLSTASSSMRQPAKAQPLHCDDMAGITITFIRR